MPLIAIATLGAVALLAGCSGGSEDLARSADRDFGEVKAGTVKPGILEGVELVNASTGGDFQDGTVSAYWGPFEEESGAVIVQDAADPAKLTASLEAGSPAFDIMMATQAGLIRDCGTVYQPIDQELVDLSGVNPEFVMSECGVPQILYGTVIAYNTEALGGKTPSSVADFFNTEEFPGKRGVGMPPWFDNGILEMGLLADGAELSELKPADIERSFGLFDALGDDLVGWTSGAESQQQIESGEVAMSIMWSSRAYLTAQEGAPVGVLWDDWVVQVDQLAVPVGVEDPEAAFAAINFTLGDQQQTDLVLHTMYSPVLSEPALPELDEVQQKWVLNQYLDSGSNTNARFWADNWDSFGAGWSDWVSGIG